MSSSSSSFARSMEWSLVLVLHTLVQWLLQCYCTSCGGARMELEGPTLISQPNPVTYFSNNAGVTISCLGKGQPPLSISWLTVNGGDPLPQLPGLREILQNGSLYFPPFRPEEYSLDIHNEQLRCSVTNPLGTLISSIFSVRAVVDSSFDLFITGSHDSDIQENNPTILRCHLSPTSYSEFVHILTWKLVDQFGYQTDVTSDARFKITPKKSLLIFSVTQEQQLIVCVAQNILTRKTQSSSPFLVKATRGNLADVSPPAHSGSKEQIVSTRVGRAVELICPVVGSPPLNFLWEKLLPNSIGVPVITDANVVIQGPVLSFSNIELSQNGTYRCETVNSFGNTSSEFHLIVAVTPTVIVEPKRKILLRLGNSVELTCRISPVSFQNMEITWTKNGKPILELGSRVKISGNRLFLYNIQWDDQGIYQCFVQIEDEHIQASASLFFEASDPQLQQTFITQSLQPGPSISLKCSGSGNPLPVISWFVDNQELQSNNVRDDPMEARYWGISDRYSVGSFKSFNEIVSHINITTVRIDDSGLYACRASNYLGTVAYSARLNIYGPLFVKEMPSLTLVANEIALVPCLYGGYPVDKIMWKKNSQDVTVNQRERFSILSNGTLMISKINKGTDKGQYQCVISNRKGEMASGDVTVNVMHPPVISSFNFDDNLIQGQRTSVTCNVISGDLPIEIVWLKDFQVIPKHLGIVETRVKFLSYLIFEELRRDHSGVYTCSASNAAATRNHSTVLDVKVPPYWIHEPQDTKVILRGTHVLNCIAGGVPHPNVKWFRESGAIKQPILNEHKFEQLEDGSLKIENVEAMDASTYSCVVNNGVGVSLSKSIYVHVNIPPKVSAPMTSVLVAEGLDAVLKCQVRGELPIQVDWRRNSMIIKQETNSRMTIESTFDKVTSILSTQLRIEGSERADSGLFDCLASNPFGRESGRISLEVKARPATPQDFLVEEIGSRFIRLRWSVGSQTSSMVPVTYFILQFKKSSSSSWSAAFNTTVQSPATHAVLEPLNPVTHYDIRIFAFNEIGHSYPTEPLAVLTLSEAPSGPPTNISAIPISSKSVLVKWSPPDPQVQHGTIIGYHAFVTPLHQHQRNMNNSIVVDEKWSLQTEVAGLKPNTQYRITVRAYNSAGNSPEASFVSVHTPEGTPDAPPENIRCEALSSKSLQVEWNPPDANLSNGQIQGFKVIYQSVQDEKLGEKPEVKKTANRETTLHGLQSYTNYSIRALAFTLGGEGVTSNPIYCVTEEDVPDEPAGIKIIPSSTTSVLASWLQPSRPNGIITKYIIYWKSEENDSKKEKSYTPNPDEEEQLSLEIRRLREHVKYTFWITASTSAGQGRASKVQAVVITSKVSARIASFPVIINAKLEDRVLLPCTTVGHPSPKISWTKGNRPEQRHQLLRNGSLLLAAIKDSDEDAYTCRAENSFGSDEVQHRILISRPPFAIPVFLGYVSSSSIQVHWEPPQKGVPPITGFMVYHRRVSSSGKAPTEWNERKLAARVSSFTFDNLFCGTSYQVKLAATNSIGVGPFSATLETTTNGGPPSENIRLSDVMDGNETAISINLNRWPDGGCPFHFVVEYRYKGSATSTWQRLYHGHNHTKFLSFNAVARGKYDVKIQVLNDAGNVTKTFPVEADADYFSTYKLVKESIAEERASGASLFADPHVIVPVISSLICIGALIFCVILIAKKRTYIKNEWKFGQSSSQQTWLSSEEAHGASSSGDGHAKVCSPGQNMSIYATLNSTKQIPMTIRDATMRFQTFGQRDNYDAAPVPVTSTNFKKKSRRKSSGCTNNPANLDALCATDYPDYRNHYECRNARYSQPNSDSDDTEDSLDPNYARPYQHLPCRNDKLSSRNIVGTNTLKKKNASRNRGGSREYLD